ncbi:hypothetical protein ACLINR_000424 [Vibrio parahaemolyticus]
MNFIDKIRVVSIKNDIENIVLPILKNNDNVSSLNFIKDDRLQEIFEATYSVAWLKNYRELYLDSFDDFDEYFNQLLEDTLIEISKVISSNLIRSKL